VIVSGGEFMRTLGLKSSWFEVSTTTDPRYGGVKVVAAAPALTGDAGPGDAVPAAAATGTRSLVRTTTTLWGKAASTKAPKTTKTTAPRVTVSVTPVIEAAPPAGGSVVLVAASAVRSVDGSTTSGTAARGVRVTTTSARR